MKSITTKATLVISAAFSLNLMIGCSGMEHRLESRGTQNYLYYPTAIIEADKALNNARKAGKDRQCPNEFNALKQTVDKSYAVYESCHTKEAIAMAREAQGKIKELCPAKAAPKPAPSPVPKKPEAKEEPKPAARKAVILEDVRFDLNKATITNEAKMILKRNIKILKENPDVKVAISGHTSASGSSAYNQKLSERRVLAVKKFLVEKGGISPLRLSTSAFGKTKMAIPESKPSMRESAAAKFNRRVTFTVIGQ